MEATFNSDLPITFQQVIEIVRQLPKSDQLRLAKLLQKEEKDSTQTHFASQSVLAQDWLNSEENKAWQHL